MDGAADIGEQLSGALESRPQDVPGWGYGRSL